MKFVISRRLSIDNTQPPIPEAKQEFLTYQFVRACPSIEVARTKDWFIGWGRQGINYREEVFFGVPSVICDKVEKELVWVVNFKSPAELAQLLNICPSLKIIPSCYAEVPVEIIIQDEMT